MHFDNKKSVSTKSMTFPWPFSIFFFFFKFQGYSCRPRKQKQQKPHSTDFSRPRTPCLGNFLRLHISKNLMCGVKFETHLERQNLGNTFRKTKLAELFQYQIIFILFIDKAFCDVNLYAKGTIIAKRHCHTSKYSISTVFGPLWPARKNNWEPLP